MDRDLVLAKSAFGNRRPPLPLAGRYWCLARIRAYAQVAAQHACTFRLMLLHFP